MRILTLAAVAALSATSFAHAATHASVDRDRDGLISYAEWQFTYGTEESRIGFNYSDRDGNGGLDLAEFNRAQDTGVLAN